MAVKFDFKADVTQWFFDRKKVLDAVEKTELRVLRLMGFRVRQSARKSLRVKPVLAKSGKKNVSKPGQPPIAHEKGGLRRIYYFYDRGQGSMIVGPVKFKGDRPTAPALHEFGGVRMTPRGMARYPKRPFMRPALEKHIPDLPALWANALGK